MERPDEAPPNRRSKPISFANVEFFNGIGRSPTIYGMHPADGRFVKEADIIVADGGPVSITKQEA
jgi:hypothetical protein